LVQVEFDPLFENGFGVLGVSLARGSHGESPPSFARLAAERGPKSPRQLSQMQSGGESRGSFGEARGTLGAAPPALADAESPT
jgi:hypothetical protein